MPGSITFIAVNWSSTADRRKRLPTCPVEKLDETKDQDVVGHRDESHFAPAGLVGVCRQRRTLIVFEHEHHRLDLPALTVGFFVERRRHQVAPAVGRQRLGRSAMDCRNK